MAKPKKLPGLKLPPGYRLATKEQLNPGEVVYVLGTHKEKPHAYGPHEVVDPATRTVRNIAKQESFTLSDSDHLLYRNGPTVVLTLGGGSFRAAYSDVPLEVFVVPSSSSKPEVNATQHRAKGLGSLPDEAGKRISRSLAKVTDRVGWPAIYGKYDIVDAMADAPPPFQMRTVMMSNQLALNALILHLVRKGQEFTCTPKCEGGEVRMTNYAWEQIARDFDDMAEGLSHVVK